MVLRNELYIVNITVDTTYTFQSADNRPYDLELNPENYTHSGFYKTLSIHIDSFSDEIDIALIGSFYSYDTDCAVLEGDILTVMQNNFISQIDLKNVRLLLHKKFDCFGCAYGLFRVPKGFIVFGELEIVGLDLNFDRVWGFSDKDIFVSQSLKKPFEIGEASIKLYDWEDNYYELDFDGHLIRAYPSS